MRCGNERLLVPPGQRPRAHGARYIKHELSNLFEVKGRRSIMPVLFGLILGVVLTVVGAYTTPRKGGLRMSCRLPPLTDTRPWSIGISLVTMARYQNTFRRRRCGSGERL